jgi:hypothetical protein
VCTDETDVDHAIGIVDPDHDAILIARTLGIEFIDENGGSPGVRLRKRQRAKSSK